VAGERMGAVPAHVREAVPAHVREAVPAHFREAVPAHVREAVPAHFRGAASTVPGRADSATRARKMLAISSSEH
jgi:hypothetical protein